MAKEKKLSKKAYGLLLILAAAVILTVPLFTIDVFINRAYLAGRDFKTAFNSRITGDCEGFIKYVLADREGWRQKCENEKRLNTDPFYEFKIKKITARGGKAFVQVELTRGASKDRYPATYEMAPQNGRWMINQYSGQ